MTLVIFLFGHKPTLKHTYYSDLKPVSYTHLDVYKRQFLSRPLSKEPHFLATLSLP